MISLYAIVRTHLIVVCMFVCDPRRTVRPEWKKLEKNHNFYKYSPIVTKFSNVLNWHKLQLLASFSKIRIGNSLFFPPLSSASKLRINQTSLKLDI